MENNGLSVIRSVDLTYPIMISQVHARSRIGTYNIPQIVTPLKVGVQ
jgi:hypothetical protein